MCIQKKYNRTNHIDHPFDNGAIGVIGSVASAGVAVGASLGVAAGISGLLVGAAIGGTVGALGSLIVAQEKPIIPRSFHPRIFYSFYVQML